MSKLLFTHSYFLCFDPKQQKLGQPYAPLGTLYAAALMREKEHTVTIFDTMFASSPDEIQTYLDDMPDYVIIYDDGFNYLTKMCLTNMREAAFQMIQLAKMKGVHVIVCSSDATDHFSEYLRIGADAIIIGEGEQTLCELVDTINSNASLSSVKGIAYLNNDIVIKTQSRPVLKELDTLPRPAWDLIDIAPYKNAWLKSAGYFSINIATTRGCPYKCNWCAKPIYGNRYNARSPENVVAELAYLKQSIGFDHVWFCDDIFGLKPGWVDQFAILLEKQKISFRFKIQSRADLLVQENYVNALKRAGCETVWMGAESGSQRILDAMDKGITLLQIRNATTLLHEHNIRVAFFIQFGYLGETKEDISETIKMIRELLPNELGISVSYPLPGTGFYEKVKNELGSKANWSHSDDLALMFHSTFSPAYYKQLHRYVHQVHRIYTGFYKWKQILNSPRHISYSSLKRVAGILYYLSASVPTRFKLNRLQHN